MLDELVEFGLYLAVFELFDRGFPGRKNVRGFGADVSLEDFV